MRPIPLLLVAALAAASPARGTAQQVFHSTQSANLPTAEMLGQGSWLFEISHRFFPPVSDGADALWGADGPAFIRLGLTYQVTDRVMLGLVRSNLDDNLGLDAKVGLMEADLGEGALKLAAAGGIAVNTGVSELSSPGVLREDNETQIHAQLLANVLLGERVAVGLAPAYLRNPRLNDIESEDHFAVGLYGQAYLTDAMSVLGEWIFTESVAGRENDSGTFGIELETRGHFFKILLTNQTRMNPTQFLGGTTNPFELDELRFGFNITRLLPF